VLIFARPERGLPETNSRRAVIYPRPLTVR
jgi:hypothetical protein